MRGRKTPLLTASNVIVIDRLVPPAPGQASGCGIVVFRCRAIKIIKARFWHWLEPFSSSKSSSHLNLLLPRAAAATVKHRSSRRKSTFATVEHRRSSSISAHFVSPVVVPALFLAPKLIDLYSCQLGNK